MKRRPREQSGDLRKEYDFSKGVRGKYAKRYKEGVTIRVVKSTSEKPQSHKGLKEKNDE